MKSHPWFNPLYRRILTFIVCLLWLAVEAYSDPSGLWTLLAMAVTAWAAWDFFLTGNYPMSEEEN